MPTYMSQFTYTNEALKALVKQPEDRGAVFREQVEKVHAFYRCMGEYDGVAIYEVPDEATASALILSVKGPGHLKEVKTTDLHTVETAMEGMCKEGMCKASEQSYRAPWQWAEKFSPS